MQLARVHRIFRLLSDVDSFTAAPLGYDYVPCHTAAAFETGTEHNTLTMSLGTALQGIPKVGQSSFALYLHSTTWVQKQRLVLVSVVAFSNGTDCC